MKWNTPYLLAVLIAGKWEQKDCDSYHTKRLYEGFDFSPVFWYYCITTERVIMKQITIQFTFDNEYTEEEFISSMDSWINDFMNTAMADNMTYEVLEDVE